MVVKKMHQSKGTLGGEHGIDNETNAVMLSLMAGLTMQPDDRAAIQWAQYHEAEIQSLREELQQKDTEISDLQQKLQEIQQKNNDLQIKLSTKDEEVEELKQRIQTLENEKRDLQEELSRVETKLKRLENEMIILNKSSKSQEEQNRKLKEDLQRVEYNFKVSESNLTKENEKLRKEVKQLKETISLPIRRQTEPIRPSLSLSANKAESLAKLHLGELCWQIQGAMYRIILPEHYTELRSYKVKSIDKDIRKLVREDDKRSEAKGKFDILKSKLNWNEDFEDTMKTLQETRNVEAHPLLDESLLRSSADLLDKMGQLKGYISLERVNELIKIWKQLHSGTIV